MTVRELIIQLIEIPLDAHIVIMDQKEGCLGNAVLDDNEFCCDDMDQCGLGVNDTYVEIMSHFQQERYNGERQ